MAGLLLSRMLNSASVHHWHQDHLAAVVVGIGPRGDPEGQGCWTWLSRENNDASRRSRREGTESTSRGD
eukprot:scaffold3401_cov109-Isochrysis_galbana.AAC.2